MWPQWEIPKASFPFWETKGETEYPSYKKNTFAYKPISSWFGPKLLYIMVHPKTAIRQNGEDF